MSTFKSKTDRAPSLDMIRGYAALIVVIAHTTVAGLYKVQPIWTYLKWTPLRVFWAGHQAVIVFFMLSGFALAHMFGEARKNRYVVFAAARIIRLYPPYIGALAVALAIYWLLERTGHVWDKGWMYTAHPKVDAQMVVDHLKMIGSYDTTPINPPMWSIVHEMRISLLYPVIFWLVARLGFKAVVLGTAVSIGIGAAALAGSPAHISWPLQDWLLTTHYATFFIIGTWFYARRGNIVNCARSLRSPARLIAWIFALALFAYPFDNPWSMGARVFGDLGSACGAFMLMALSFTIENGRVFSLGSWLGKISFSLYLNHYVILSASLVLFYSHFGAVPVWFCTLAGAIGLAVLMNKMVEVPSQRLARWVRQFSPPLRVVQSNGSMAASNRSHDL
ncbi:acyltransferase family protein [Paraburkholderia sacchari]|uniref:acyltransferase family protein n=1 Tax=Paraburkholderia sacchari TaxID=159450 RepID=UPI003D998235